MSTPNSDLTQDPTSTTPAPPPAAPHAMQVLALGSLGVFVVFLDTTIVNVAFATMSRSFDTTASHLSWVLNAYSLAFAATLIPAGRLADRYGRKRLFLIGLTGFALVSALCGLAPTADVLIAARVLQAAFAALIVPTSLALILPEFPPSKHSMAVGAWGAMGGAAAAMGPTLGALLTEYASWRWVFLVNVPICAAMIAIGNRLLRESRVSQGTGVPDVPSAVLVAAIPAALSYGIIEGPQKGWDSASVMGAFATAAVLIPPLLWRSRTAPTPVIDLTLFRVRQFSLVNASIFSFAVAFYGLLLGNIIFLQSVWGYSVLHAALASAPGPILVALVGREAGKLAQRIGYRRVLIAGGIAWAAAVSLFATQVTESPHWAEDWLPATLIMGLGIGLTLPVQSGAAVQPLPPHQYGLGSAISQSFRQLGAVLGISVFVAVIGNDPKGKLSPYQHLWWIFAALGMFSSLLPLIPSRRRTSTQNQEESE
ncbi:MFS transporter [Streptomyces sp. CoH27]|uniref:MFS transporter n=1 Tax=Streptomyces sp. CoH27 TaxID=2875763 RepID=UPI001CD601FB|nr:MFS transporter [Streptomyces sp. CoH27]